MDGFRCQVSGLGVTADRRYGQFDLKKENYIDGVKRTVD